MLSTQSDQFAKSITQRLRQHQRIMAGADEEKIKVLGAIESRLRADADSSALLLTGHAQIPSGKHSNEPRCDMPPKRKPPSP